MAALFRRKKADLSGRAAELFSVLNARLRFVRPRLFFYGFCFSLPEIRFLWPVSPCFFSAPYIRRNCFKGLFLAFFAFSLSSEGKIVYN